MSIRPLVLLPVLVLAFSAPLSAQSLPPDSDLIEFFPGSKAKSGEVNFNFDLLEATVRDIALYSDDGTGTLFYDPDFGTIKQWSISKTDELINEVFPANGLDPLTGFLLLGTSSIAVNSASILTAQLDILANTAGIAANTGDISVNTGDIATLISDLDALEIEVAAIVAEIGVTINFASQTLWETIDQMYAGHTNQGVLIADHEGRIALLEAWAASVNAVIATIQGDIDGLDSRLAAVEAQLATISSDIAANAVAIATLQGEMVQAQSDIATLQGEIGQAQSDIAILQGEMFQAQSDILANASDIAINVVNIATNVKDIATNVLDILALDGRMDAAETQIGINVDDIEDLDNQMVAAIIRLDAAEAQIATNVGDIGDLFNQIAAAAARLDAAEAQIAINAGDISDLDGRVSFNENHLAAHDTALADHESRIGVLETTDADHEARITDNESDIGDIQTTLSDHETRLSDLEYWATLVSPHGQQTFFADATWDVPEGVGTFYVTVIGGGGGAAKRGQSIPGDYAGGDGASLWKTELTGILAGDQVNITIGVGGKSAIGAPSQGVSGTATIVEFVASVVTLTADGGEGGIADAVLGGTPGQDGWPLEGMVLRYNGQGADIVLDGSFNLTSGNPGMVLIEW